MGYVNALSQDLFKGTEENYGNSHPG